VAKQFSISLQQDYFAGIWNGEWLHAGLLWKADRSTKEKYPSRYPGYIGMLFH
jgi:hypothetical protein